MAMPSFAVAAPTVTATKEATTASGPGGSTQPAGTIDYKITIQNTSGVETATGVSLTDAAPAHTADVGSFKVSPLAFPDAYNAVKNALLHINAAGVLANDKGVPTPTAVAIAAGPTTQAGTVTLNADGSFDYTPPNNFTGTDTFTYTVTNGQAPNDTATVTFTVQQPPAFTSADNAAFQTLVAGTVFNVTTSGAPTVTTIGRTGTLPTGVNFTDNGDGTAKFDGTPAAGTGGTYTQTLTASNGVAPNAVQTFTLTVNQPPLITSANNKTFTAGVAGTTFQLTASGFPTTFTFTNTGAALPGGLSLSSAGLLSGTPDAGTGGTYNLTFQVANGISPAGTQSFTLTVNEAPTIASFVCGSGANCSGSDGITFQASVAGIVTFSATGFPSGGSIVLSKTGTLPSGLTFTNNGDGTAKIAGTPAVGSGGIYSPITIIANNGVSPNGTRDFILTVTEAPTAVNDPTGGIPSNSSPAVNTYHIPLNGSLGVGSGLNVLTNDTLGEPDATVTSFGKTTGLETTVASNTTGTTLASGTVQVFANGTFTYTPPSATFTGLDSFKYTITNTTASSTATVSLAVGIRPAAVNETYPTTLIRNVGINTATSSNFSVLTNDTGDQRVAAFVSATNGSGTVAADGKFTFVSSTTVAGNTNGTIVYSVTNGFGSVNATVTIPLGAGRIWFIDQAASNGNGQFGTPFKNLSNFVTANPDAASDNIFLYSSGTNYTGPVTLEASEKLIGQGASATLQAITGLTFPADSGAEPVMNTGARPTIDTSGITLNTGNTIRGLTVGNTGANTKIFGSGFGTLTIGNNTTPDVSLSGTGQALSLTTGTFAASSGFVSVASTTSAATGITLNAVAGTATFGSTTITSATTQGIFVTASSADINFGATSVGASGVIGAEGVRLDTNTGGMRTFGTLTIANAATFGFVGTGDVTNGGGNATIGAATISSVNSGVVMQRQSTGTTINFSGGASVTTAGAGNAGILTSTSNVGTLTFSALSVQTTTGAGMNLSSGGTINVTNGTGTINNTIQAASAIIANGIALNANFSSINSSGGANGVILTNVTGTSNFGSGALSLSTGDTFFVGGQNGTFTYNGTIASGSAHSINVTGKTGGTVTFGGAVTDTDTGITLTSNTGATITFTGGLSLTTTINAAFTATGGGTISVTQDVPNNKINTITTTSGTALQVTSTTIGASGLTFRSISSNGAANGIVLNATGSNGLTVTGNSAGICGGSVTNFSTPGTLATVTAPNTADCTGGTIQSSTGTGVSLTSASNVSLTRMRIINGGSDGINGTTVNGLTLAAVDIENNGNAVGENGMEFSNLTGTVSVTNSTVSGNFSDNFKIINTSGTLSSFTVSGSSFSQSSIPVSPAGGNGFVLTTQNASVITTGSISSSVFRKNFSNGVLVNSENTSSIGSFTVQNCSFDDNNIQLQAGQFFSSNFTCKFLTNTLFNQTRTATSGANSTSTSVITATSSTATGGTLLARIQGNFLGNSGVPGSGSSTGNGIRSIIQGLTDATVIITGNNVRQCPVGFGLDIESLGSTSGTPPTSDMTITNNDVNHIQLNFKPGTSDFPLPAIYVAGDNQGTAGKFRTDVTGNTVPGSCTGQFLGTCMELYEYTGPNGDLELVDNPPASASATAELQSHNTGSIAASASVALIAGPINVPPLLFARGGVERENPERETVTGNGATRVATSVQRVTKRPPAAAPAPISSQPSSLLALTQQKLDSIVATARARWESTGLTSEQSTALQRLKFEVADLPSIYLGEADGNHIRVDNTAGGNGWFIDAKASSDALFAKDASGTRSYTDSASAPAGRIDLLTTILHEMGHALGLPDTYDAKDRDKVMYGFLTTGERRVPAAGDAVGAKPGELVGPHYLGPPAVANAYTIGDIPPGKTVVVTFSVQVENPLVPANTTQISNQGTVKGTNLAADVLTDDPNVAGAANPTVTLLCANPATVINLNDAGAGSLRQALVDVCDGGAINFQAGLTGTITLSTGHLVVDKSVTINGPGSANNVVINVSANNSGRVFRILTGKIVEIKGLEIADGNPAGADFNGEGGGILNQGTLTVRDCLLDNNHVLNGSPRGGAIDNFGTLYLISSRLHSNSAASEGGAIRSFGPMTITDSSLFNNTAGTIGGAILSTGSTAIINNSTLSLNTAASDGGAIQSNGTLKITNSTLSGNQATGATADGGALRNLGPATLVNVTMASNTAGGNGGGICNSNSGTVTIKNSIVALNTANGTAPAGPDISGSANADYSLIGDSTGATITGANNLSGDPKIGLLANNGGPTNTRVLLPDSPALDAGTSWTTLTAAITNSQTNVDVNDATALAIGSVILIDTEQMTITAKATNTLTVTRGTNATTAAAHSAGAAVTSAFDQRAYPRVVDSGDAGTVATIDMGAVEANYVITATAGTPQSAAVGTTFATNLQATVTESTVPVSGVLVTFTAPGAGASGTFSPGNTATTNASGVATADPFTANSTAGSYNVTAAGANIPGSATYALTNTGGPATQFLVTAPANATAGTAFSITVTAQDGSGNTDVNYTGTVTLTRSDNAAGSASPGNYTFVAGDNGVHTFTNGVTFVTAGNQTVTATDGAKTGTSNNVLVSAASATHFSVVAPGGATAGSAFNFAVTAQDQFNNTDTGYAGTVHFTSSDGAASLPADYTFVGGDNGAHTFSATLNTAGNQTITATQGAVTGTSNTIVVGAGSATHFSVTAPASATAGTPFTFSVTALDASNNVVTGYTGTVHFTKSDSGAGSAVPPDYTFVGGDNGAHTFTNGATFVTAGNQTITATQGAVTGTSNSVAVSAANANHFSVVAPANATAGSAFTFAVTALDQFNNTATGYTGTVHFTKSDSGSGSAVPGDYTFVAGDNGAHTFTNGATFVTVGNQTITATQGAVTGTSNNVTVSAANATHFSVVAPSNSSAGSAFNFTVTALDQFNNTDTGYAGTVHFTSSDGAASLPADYTFVGGDSGAHTFSATLNTAGNQTITATQGAVTGTSNTIAVGAGSATHFSVTAPASATAGTPFSFSVTALDASNNVATGYTGTVHFTKSDSGAGSAVPADYTFVAGDNGAHTFTNGATFVTVGNQTITATQGAVTGTSNNVNVSAASANHFSVVAPGSATAGSAFTFSVTALDQFNNTATGYTGTVHFTKSDSGAGSAVPADYTFVAGDNGAHSFTNGATFVTVGNQTITATQGAVTGTSNNVAVSAANATHFSVSAPASATAGSAFSFTVTALDQFNNTATGYAGTVHFTSTDGAATLPADTTLTNGAGTFNATLKTAGGQTITAKDTANASIAGTSNSITVNAGPATHFTVSAPASATAGAAFNFTVTALDQFNNTATGYAGTVHFTSTDGAATLPANSTLASGVGTFSATLKTAGAQTITATDTVTASINGTSNTITVGAGTATHFTVSAPPNVPLNSAFNFSVTALDQFNNTATAYAGTVHFTSTDGAAVLPADSTLTSGAGTFSATLKTPGPQTITAKDTANAAITGTSNTILAGKVTPTITTTASGTINLGGNVSDSATLAGGFTPTGSITFRLYGPNDATCGNAAVFTSAAIPVNGNASYNSGNFTPTTAGTYRWIASYSGDTNNNAVAGACNDANESVIVNKGNPAISGTVSPASGNIGTPFTDTATLSSGSSPTGTITFTVHGPNTDNCAAPIFTSTKTVAGNANYTSDAFTTTQPGTYKFLAVYSGDANNNSVATVCGVASQTFTVNGPSPSPTPTPTATPAQALNISTRMRTELGDKAMIGGFIITGNASKSLVLRGIGPSLSAFNLSDLLLDPELELRGSSNNLIFKNKNWKDDQRPLIEGTNFQPKDDRESVIVITLNAGAYTALLTGKDATEGIGLVEIYDTNPAAASELGNISTRGMVRTDDKVMIGGFTLGGPNNATRIAVRGLGPSLSQFNLSPLLANPVLELRNENGTIMVTNDDWTDDPVSAANLTANGLGLSNPKESGIFISLTPPGQFTAILSGKNGGIGIGLVEIYNLK
ncbi:MAG: hypothetical protein V7609_1877 [Verrucomicrobiota bacterium]